MDYAMYSPYNELLIMIEAKSLASHLETGSAEGKRHQKQLSDYAQGRQYGVGVLTNGKLWHLYDLEKPGTGKFEDRLTAKVDICNGSIPKSAQALNRCLRNKWW